MTFPNTFINGTPADADEVNANFNSVLPWMKIVGNQDSSIASYLIKFSSTTWSTESRRTTDSGATWATPGFGGGYLAAADGTKGVAIDQDNSANSVYTTDSGATWNASSTDPDLDTSVDCISIYGSVAVCGGRDAGGNKQIFYSSDGGNNWSQATTGPTGAGGQVWAISMASATVGYAVDNSANIWKTTDGGDNWTDTTDDMGLSRGTMIATDTDTVYMVDYDNIRLTKYVNSTNTVTSIFQLTNVNGRVSNLVKTTNGDICFAFWPSNGTTANVQQTILLYKYDGTNVYERELTQPNKNANNNPQGTFTAGTDSIAPSLIEVNNVLYLNIENKIIEIKLE